MKKSFYFLVAALVAATVSFSSCQKEELGNGKGDKSSLVIKLPSTRLVDDAQVAAATPIDPTLGVVVFLMDGNAKVSVEEFTTGEITAKYKRIEDVSPEVDNVIVVANVPSSELTAVKAESSKNGIKLYAYSLNEQNAVAGLAGKTLYGESGVADVVDPLGNTTDHAGHDYKEANVDLKAITARIEFGAIKAGNGIASIKIEHIWINSYNVDGSGAVNIFHPYDWAKWNTTPTSTNVYATAGDIASITVPASTYDYTGVHDAYSAAVDGVAKVYAYHIFTEAPATPTPHVILLVSGQYDTAESGASSTFTSDLANKYFVRYITISGYSDNGTNVSAFKGNTIYKLGVGTDQEIVIDWDDLTEDPESGVYDLGINVDVVEWDVKNVTPTIQ
jgi:hypothetical protein